MRPAARASPPGRTTCAFAAYANFNGIGVIGQVKGYNTVREAKKSIVTPALTSATFAVVIMPSLTPLSRRISSNRFHLIGSTGRCNQALNLSAGVSNVKV